MKKILFFMGCTALVSMAGFGVNAGMLKTATQINAPKSVVETHIVKVAANSDDGLYDPVAPAGSAFVRFFNGTQKNVDIKAGAKSYDAVGINTATPYYVVPKGNVEFTVDGDTVKTDIMEGKFYTIVHHIDGDTVVSAEDKALEDKTKALVTLYNYTKTEDLKLVVNTNGKNVDMVSDVDSFKNAGREVNPFELNLKIMSGDKELAQLKPVSVERGSSYSVFATQDADGKIQANLLVGKTDTKK